MFCQSNLLFGRSDAKFRGRNAKFRAPEFYFRGSKFLFRGSYGKIPVQKSFRGGSGGVFLSRWNFFPDTFPLSFCRRNPPAGFPAGRVSAPGVPRVPSKGQVWRGFRDILISARRAWLRFFRAVPAWRPNTRISEGENEQIVNAHPKMFILSMEGCVQGERISFRAEIRIMSLFRGGIAITADFGPFAELTFIHLIPIGFPPSLYKEFLLFGSLAKKMYIWSGYACVGSAGMPRERVN